MLDATNKTDGFLVWARRKPQRYRVVSRGFATRPGPKRRGFMSQIASNTTLAADDQFIYLVSSMDFDEQKQLREGTQAAETIDYFAEHFGCETAPRRRNLRRLG
jgi:hypothetical protein